MTTLKQLRGSIAENLGKDLVKGDNVEIWIPKREHKKFGVNFLNMNHGKKAKVHHVYSDARKGHVVVKVDDVGRKVEIHKKYLLNKGQS